MPVRGSLPDGVVMAFDQATAATVETPWAAVAQLQRGAALVETRERTRRSRRCVGLKRYGRLARLHVMRHLESASKQMWRFLTGCRKWPLMTT
jgi:hypothetical protein